MSMSCLCVGISVRSHISKFAIQTLQNFLYSVLHPQMTVQCIVYTSGFLGDVTFAYNWLYVMWLIGYMHKVTHQGAELWTTCDVCDYLVGMGVALD